MFSALTLNMQNGQVWDDDDPDNAPVELEETIRFLRSQDADLIFLQEVERGHRGGRQVDPPPNFSRLQAALPEYDSAFRYPIPNPRELPFGLGLAIFSRTPLENVRTTDLPPPPLRFEFEGVERDPSHRLLMVADTSLESRRLRLLNTHLQSFFIINASSDEHPAQRNLIEDELRKDLCATVLAGDFNSAPGEGLVAQFQKAGFDVCQNEKPTWRRQSYVLDHIFYSNALRLEHCAVIPTRASDHHCVRSEFSFTG